MRNLQLSAIATIAMLLAAGMPTSDVSEETVAAGWFSKSWKAVKNVVSDAGNNIGTAVDAIVDAGNAVTSGIGNGFNAVSDAVTNIGLGQLALDAGTYIGDATNNVLETMAQNTVNGGGGPGTDWVIDAFNPTRYDPQPTPNPPPQPNPPPPVEAPSVSCINNGGLIYDSTTGMCYKTQADAICRGHFKGSYVEGQGCTVGGVLYSDYVIIQCSGGGLLKEGQCWPSQANYDQAKCTERGDVWSGSKCLTKADQEQACRDLGKKYYAEGCFQNDKDRDRYVCTSGGSTWYKEKCHDPLVAAELQCNDLGDVWLDAYGCLKPVDIKDVCRSNGHLWLASESACVVPEGALPPLGLDEVYIAVHDIQNEWLGEALEGAWADLLSGDAKLVKELLVGNQLGLAEYYEAAVDELVQALLDDMSLVADIDAVDNGARQEALDTYHDGLTELNRFSAYVVNRMDVLGQARGNGADTALGALQHLLTGADADSIEFAFPSGLPTPKESKEGNNWVVDVPVQVELPRIEGPFGEAAMDLYQYRVTADIGGRKTKASFEAEWVDYRSDDVALDEVIRVVFPRGKSAYDLEISIEAKFLEEHFTADGDSVVLEGLRVATIDRVFRTNAAGVLASMQATGGSSSEASSSQVYMEGDASQSNHPPHGATQPSGRSGTSPGVTTVNRFSEWETQIEESARQVDQEHQLGLGVLVRYWPYLAGAIALFLMYRFGVLDRLPGVGAFRSRKQEDPHGLEGLDIDLDGLDLDGIDL